MWENVTLPCHAFQEAQWKNNYKKMGNDPVAIVYAEALGTWSKIFLALAGISKKYIALRKVIYSR